MRGDKGGFFTVVASNEGSMLLQSELRLLQVLMDNIPDSIYFKDSNNKFIKVNKAKADHSGTTAEEMIGKTDFDFMSREQATKACLDDEQVIQTGIPITNKVERVTHMDGTEVYNSVTKIPWYDAHGVIIGTIGLSRDITELIRSKERLQEKSDQLKEINSDLERRVQREVEKRRIHEELMTQQTKLAAMGEMITMIAHQWRTPLNIMALLMQDLQDACDSDHVDKGRVIDAAGEAISQINFMANTINDFKDFCKPSKSKGLFDVKVAVEAVCAITSALLRHNSVEIRVNCTRSDRVMVYGYQNEFKQVILNIITNAVDSINDKRTATNVKGLIEIDIDRDDEKVTLVIKDNGKGIEPEIIDRIFDHYFTTKKDNVGSGIGLYMSKIIIENSMGGNIYTTSKDGKTAFVIELKL
ncbi:PAS/PAC sensor signal transduction histidine kinase [Candidatus Magnetobacterium bavaricum]|uniref:histidine kinase n=1 Tax=Candidatus Magnetobacterium bavaricum TaxID=29290 RepID=A0A0F3GYZ6_9BACT|nr:PAS/PAC sensor signal transduction histidine kinase [Candidatus Magnetobacterium bavaricum]